VFLGSTSRKWCSVDTDGSCCVAVTAAVTVRFGDASMSGQNMCLGIGASAGLERVVDR
jgi:hypothetical protein